MLYVLKGDTTNVKVVMQATAQQIADFCLLNEEIGTVVFEKLQQFNYEKWLSLVTTELSLKMNIPYIDAMCFVEKYDTLESKFKGFCEAEDAAEEIYDLEKNNL